MLSLHWDGGSLLFVSNTLGSTASEPTVLYLGGLGVMDAKGNLEVWDRDASGTQESAHSATWFAAWSGWPSYTIGGHPVKAGSHSGTTPSAESVGPMPGACMHNNTQANATVCPVSDPFVYTPIQQPRSDGYAYSRRMGSGTYQRSLNFQGVRVYDNTSAQWLTPDVYAGTASDPMSQQPFMWNNNNPVAYADPSGYCVEDACVGETILAGTAIVELELEVDAAIETAVGDKAVATAERSMEKALNDKIQSAVSRFSSGIQKEIQRNFQQGGLRALRSTVRSLSTRISQHEAKIAVALAAGGPAARKFISSMQTEIRAAQPSPPPQR